ncbi:MAG TPA: aldolase/citrate lyase family protein [Candidatus Acidoferrales bacterium]|nr:aldolase/citrate lyase family protein [Candidatus Acidoferrales bacterium]
MSQALETRALSGEAGHWGEAIRSDVHVRIEPHERGGIAIELESRVKPYYGDSIRRQTEEVLEALGVRHARVEIHDEGALPFVTAARIEAAVKRAGLGEGTRVLPDRVALPEPSPRDRMRRSRLYVPGSEPKYFINAALHGADGVILDLEDSVHPGEKDAARLLVRNALRAVDLLQCERMVRINQLPLGLADLDEIVPESPDLILIPKVENPGQVVQASQRIADIKADYGIIRPIWLMPILESALGIENAFAIAKASEEIVALTIGLEDYTADLGVVKTSTGAESLYARQRVVNAAHAAGVQAIDSVFGDVADMDGLRAWGLDSRAMGFEGMGCVHPLQIAVIHEAFAPTEAEIERARKIVAAYDEAREKGLGVVSLGSKMIDPPVVQRALKLMARARAMGLTGSDDSLR